MIFAKFQFGISSLMNLIFGRFQTWILQAKYSRQKNPIQARKSRLSNSIQIFVDLHCFDIRNFLFIAVYNSVLFSSPLVLQSNLDLFGFCFPVILCPLHINSNGGMPVFQTGELQKSSSDRLGESLKLTLSDFLEVARFQYFLGNIL